MVDGGPWDNATINNTLKMISPNTDLTIKLTTGYFPLPTPSGAIIISQGLQGVKDVAALGNLSTESPTRLSFSSTGYTDCARTDIGKLVKCNGSTLENTVLIQYDNTERMWWLSRPHNINIGDVLTLELDGEAGQGTGTRDSRSTLLNTGGGAVMIGKGYERFDDPPRICLTNGDTLYITAGSSQYVGADAVVANLKIKDLAASGSLNVTGAATFSNAINVTGYLNCNNLVKLKHYDSNTEASLLSYYGGGYSNNGGLAMDLYGNLMFVGASTVNSWNIYNNVKGTSGRHVCFNVGYDGTVQTYGNLYNSQAGGSGSENGSIGISAHRWSTCYIRTFHGFLTNEGYDEYDDLAIVKQWGEKNPALPADYKGTLRPKDNDPFSMLRTTDDDTFFNLNEVVNFSLGCSKALAKKHDEHAESISAMYGEIEQLREKVSQLEAKLAS